MKPLVLFSLAAFIFLYSPLQAQPEDGAVFALGKGDIIKAVVSLDAAGQTKLTVTFTPEKRLEFASFTGRNLNKQVKLILNGKVYAAPVIRSQMYGPTMEIPVDDSPADAATTGQALLAQLSPQELETTEQKLKTQTAEFERQANPDPVRNALVSKLQAALDAHDKTAFEACFNFDGTDEKLRPNFTKIEDEIFAMPSHYVFTQERIDQGKAHALRAGKYYTLNGEWIFDVGIYVSKSPSKGFVLPAGMAHGKCQVLLSVEEKS